MKPWGVLRRRGVVALAIFAGIVAAPGASGRVVHAAALGTSWREVNPPAGTYPALNAVSCVPTGASAHCVAVASNNNQTGSAALVSSDGGDSWTVHTVPGADDLSKIDCSSASLCMATGVIGEQPGLEISTDGGAAWTKGPKIGGGVGGVSCLGRACWIAAGSIDFTPDGGQHFTTERLARGFSADYVVFVNMHVGYAIGDDPTFVPETFAVFKTSDGGKSWSTLKKYVGPTIDALSCTDTTQCWVGFATTPSPQPALAYTNDGGRHWKQTKLPAAAGSQGLEDISCERTGGADQCYAVASSRSAGFVFSTADGVHWQGDAVPSGSYTLGGVALANGIGVAVGSSSNQPSQPVVLRSP